MNYDKRLVERLIRNGELTQEELDKYNAGLVDVADNAVEIETKLEDPAEDADADAEAEAEEPSTADE